MASRPPSATLTVLNEELAGMVYTPGARLVLGRSSNADVFLPDMTISRIHCEVRLENGRFVLEDLGSRGGTKVNDRFVQRVELHAGDLISIGKFRIRFDLAKPETSPPRPSPPDQTIVAPLGALAAQDDSNMPLKQVDVSGFNLAAHVKPQAATAQDLAKLRHHLQVVQSFSASIQTTLDLTGLLDKTLEALFGVFDKMDAGVVFLKDPKTGELVYRASLTRRASDRSVTGISRTILAHAGRQRQAVLSFDARADARFQQSESVQLTSMRTHMCVPLICVEELLGFLYMMAAQELGVFSEDDLNLVTALAGPMAVCIKNAMLVEAVRRETALRTGLQRYVSGDLAEKLLAADVEHALAGQRREGICLFCDLVGFTSLSERLAPARVAQLLNRYFEKMLEIVFRFGGSINKFGGDSFLAVWGALAPLTDGPAQVIEAAFAMQRATFDLNQELRSEALPRVESTIGTNRGPFFAGNIGSERRMEFTVIGDTINVAARIQELAHPGQVLTSMASIEAIQDRLVLIRYGDRRVRGRSTPLGIVSVRAIRTDQPARAGTVLCALPVRVSAAPAGEQPGLIVGARLLPSGVDLELLGDAPVEPGRPVEFRLELPEFPHLAQQPVAAVGLADEETADRSGGVRRVHVADPPEFLLPLLTPGTQLDTTTDLRHKG